MNRLMKRIHKLETDGRVGERIYVVAAPAEHFENYVTEAIASAGLLPAKERDLVVVVTRFETDAVETNALLCS